MFVYGDVVMLKIGRYWPWKTVTVSSLLHMLVRPTLLHRKALVSFLLFRKNLGSLREFFGQIVYQPPGKNCPYAHVRRRWPECVGCVKRLDFLFYWWNRCSTGRSCSKANQRLTGVSFSFVQKYFFGWFSPLFFRVSNHQLVVKMKLSHLNSNFALALLAWVILTQL